ncbi:NAD-dependent epimerase/dehydratase [Lenzites betulinus]|nr:NAD-dependent epimerase/dehydratase [Lenzites betulinus]
MPLNKTELILVTGGHGFIGGHVARKLGELGYRLRVVDTVPEPLYAAPPVGEVVVGNLCDSAFAARVVDGVGYVLHFAATMGGMGTIHAANGVVIYKENHTMTVNLIDACVAAGTRGFFYASSACVYPESLQGLDTDISLAESDVWKNAPPHPQGLYGLEKLASELVLEQHQSRMEVRIARFHNVFGPLGSWYGGREKVPAAFLRKAVAAQLSGDVPATFEIWGDGLQRRSFCFIEDAVEAVLRLLESDCSEPVNIGSDQAVSVQDLADMALAVASVDRESVVFRYKTDRPVGVGSRNSNNALVSSKLGWTPRHSLAEGMRITGDWIRSQTVQMLSTVDDAEKERHIQLWQTSDVVDLQADAITFAVLLPVTSRGSNSPEDCLANLREFARSLLLTTADDVARLGERYAVKIYIAIDDDDEFLWKPDGINRVESVLREERFPPESLISLRCEHPRGHVCALWRDCAERAYRDRCDYYILMGDDLILQDSGWMSAIHRTFSDLARMEGVPHGIGCVAFTDTSFPGMPTFPAIHRTHMDIFGGQVIPDVFTNQDGDPFLFQLYRRWGCSRMVPSRISNKLGGSGDARYEKVHASGWTLKPLDDATTAVEDWLRVHAHKAERKLSLDVIVPCYRVSMFHLDMFLTLPHSHTSAVMFIIIVDDPQSPRIGDLAQKYGHRPDVRIRVNSRNLGASASRNRGLQESAAEWALFLDDDVVPDEDILLEAEKSIRAHPRAAGFVGNAQFPLATSVFTTAVHLAGVTFFWDIAEKIEKDLPWGVTANLIARRNVPDAVQYSLQFPKTGGGEDIDYCRQKRKYSLQHGGEGFWAAPAVKVTHPWWNMGRRSYWRFYMWSKGDGGLVKLYPEHSYRDVSPNAAECLFLGGLVLIAGCGIALLDAALGFRVAKLALMFCLAVTITNIAHDIVRHAVLHPERTRGMKSTVTGTWWVCAMVEGAVLRMFSEWGRVVGIFERREYTNLLLRFDWFCGRWGEGPKQEEMRNNRTRLACSIAVFGLLAAVAGA